MKKHPTAHHDDDGGDDDGDQSSTCHMHKWQFNSISQWVRKTFQNPCVEEKSRKRDA